MSTGSDQREPEHDLSTWPIERLQAFTADAHEWSQLESVRVVAQQHAYDSNQSCDAGRRWAELSLLVNRRMRGTGGEESARELQQDFMLRTWVIDHLGTADENSDWSPEALGADTLAALAFSPSEAAALAGNWRELPLEQIHELRRHKNLTAHLERLIGYLQPGPTRDRLLPWIETRQLLP
ncbi:MULTISPECIES: hypothetical protein [unclassified Streptomyces]|uniref:hypothetical protein n=2 Tax=Streptomyces TaxID=1883 RepID=UPI00119EC521|nr:hypothetical protein [Streptomyces sp. BK340]TVZ75467.1 hypothetical protein FB157_1571 [Streptomyces sp. BK340]